MSSSFSTGQSQRRDSGSSSVHIVQSVTSSSGGVVPGTKTSGQNGKETISSSTTTTTSPPGSSNNIDYQTPNSPQPSQLSNTSSSGSQRGSATDLKVEDVDRWFHVVQGADVPEEIKAIVRTGTHAWSRGIAQKATSTATPAARG